VNGEKESVCVVLSQSGAKTLVEVLSKYLDHLDDALKPWDTMQETPQSQNYVQ
jgi:hypothetical protein